jgi:hypothetical protein
VCVGTGSGRLNDLWTIEAPTDIIWPLQAAEGLFTNIYDWDTLVVWPNTDNVLPERLVLCSGFYPCELTLNGVGGNGVLKRKANGSIECLSSNGCTSISLESMRLVGDGDPGWEPVLKMESTALVIDRVVFEDCASWSDGGAVRCYGSGVTVNVSSSLFIRIKSGDSGGAISAVGCSVTVANTSFKSCYASTGGGAISATQFQCYGSAKGVETRLSLTDCHFEECGSEAAGGAILASSASSSANLTAARFNRCWSNASGGAVSAVDQAVVHVSDSIFEDNIASISGGAVTSAQKAILTVSNSNFSGNIAVGLGGGAAHSSDAWLLFQDILATRNKAPQGAGGVIFWEGSMRPTILEAGRDVQGLNAALCGKGNSAVYGSCLASAYKWLDVQSRFDTVFSGLQFLVMVVKRDAYNQTMLTDSQSVLQAATAIAQDSGYLSDFYVGLSGSFIVSLDAGQADFSIILKPSFAHVDSVRGITQLMTQPAIYFKGLDAETSRKMQSFILPVTVQADRFVCPPGFILVLDQPRSGSNQTARQGACSQCSSGTYSIGPLYGVTTSEPSCLNCPSSATCKGGNTIEFSLGTWTISSGMYKLVSCPAGHQLVNSVAGVFSHDVQNCLPCASNEYILNSSKSGMSCEKCPVGAECDGNSLTSLVDGALWFGDINTGLYHLRSCPAGYEMQVATLDSQQCVYCPAASYCEGGNSPRVACPEGTYSPPGANVSSSCMTVVYVALSLTLPLTREEFTSAQQSSFQQALAAAAGVGVGYVTISSVSNRRAGTIQVD